MDSLPKSQPADHRAPALFASSIWDDPDSLAALLDSDGTILDLNEPMAAGLGGSPHELRGTPIWLHMLPENRADFRESFERVVATARTGRFESGCKGMWHESVLRPCLTEDHKVFAVTMLATERKRMEDQSRLQAEILRQMQEGVNLVRTSDGSIVYTNPTYDRLLGYEPGELIGRHVSTVNAPEVENPQATAGRIIAQLKETGCWQGEIANRRKDGATVRNRAVVSTFEHPEFGEVWVGVVNNITESKRCQLKMEQQSALIGSILNSFPDIVFFKNRDGVYSHCNFKLSQALGRPMEDILGKTDHEFFPMNTADAFQRDDRLALESAEPLHVEESLVLPDGSSRVVDTLKTRVVSPDGEVLGILGVARDITDRKLTEEALRRSDNLQRTILSSMVEGVVFLGPDGRIINCNASAERILGRTRDQILGLASGDPGWRTVHEDGSEYAGADHPAIRSLSTGKGYRDMPMGIELPDGSRRWISINTEPVFHAGEQKPYAVIASFGDITQRKVTELRLKESETRFMTLFRSSPVPTLLGGDRNTQAADVNDAFLRMVGYTREEVVGHTSADYAFWLVPEQRSTLMSRLLQHGEVRDFEMQFRRKSGQIGDALISITFLDIAGKRHTIAMFTDTTDRKRVEERLRQSQKMEAVGHLAGGMAHEFNNILAAMLLNLSLARLGGEIASQRQILEDLEEGCKRAATLIKQLLAFSRQSVMSPRSLSMAGFVADHARTLKPFLGERIRLEISAPDNLPLVRADKALLGQALLNLCLNARDAMPDGGLLRFELSLETIAADRAGAHPDARPGLFVRLSVADTGCGMDESVKIRLFEPFFSTKGVGNGTGLGLATVRGIVQQHNGWIEVQSTPGKGSTFRVYLPAAEATAPSNGAPNTASATAARGNGTILLAEDDATLRGLVVALLKRHGYRVLEAEDGDAALALWAAHHHEIDLLYSDMVMPGKWSGLQLAERFRAEKPRLKVIITSGYNTDIADIEKAAAESIVYLPKPCPPDMLLDVLNRSIRQDAG